MRLDLNRVDLDPSVTYEMAGVLSFGRGLFRREPVTGTNTSYKFFNRLGPDHIVMSQLFGWEGALALSSAEFAGLYVSPQFPTFLCDGQRLEKEFIGWLMRRPSFWDDLGTRTKGMGDRRRTLNPDALLSCNIPLPPLDEQRRIVARIEKLAAKIGEVRELREQILSESDALCRSMIFGAPENGVRRSPMAAVVKLRQPDVQVQREAVYQFAGVYCFGKGVFRGHEKSGMEFQYSSLTRLRTGDFVYPKLMAWEGALGVVPSECDGLVVSPEFPVFEIDQSLVLPETLDVYFRTPSVWPLLAEISTGTNVRRRRLHPSAFLRFEVALPTMNRQLKFREVKSRVEALKKLQAETAAELDALLPSVLDKAFKGGL